MSGKASFTLLLFLLTKIMYAFLFFFGALASLIFFARLVLPGAFPVPYRVKR